jgi:hypothetical protein
LSKDYYFLLIMATLICSNYFCRCTRNEWSRIPDRKKQENLILLRMFIMKSSEKKTATLIAARCALVQNPLLKIGQLRTCGNLWTHRMAFQIKWFIWLYRRYWKPTAD